MNIGKLVREKMKLHRTDCSGEYVDNTGKHFTMKLAGEGYTVSYGGEKMREVDISKEQGLKLAGNCRKLELVEGEKRLAKTLEGDEIKPGDKVTAAGLPGPNKTFIVVKVEGNSVICKDSSGGQISINAGRIVHV